MVQTGVCMPPGLVQGPIYKRAPVWYNKSK